MVLYAAAGISQREKSEKGTQARDNRKQHGGF